MKTEGDEKGEKMKSNIGGGTRSTHDILVYLCLYILQ